MSAVPAAPIKSLVDTTGAGDLFAAGFVTGLVRGLDHEACARLGALAAAEIIQHIGARPKVDLKSSSTPRRTASPSNQPRTDRTATSARRLSAREQCPRARVSNREPELPLDIIRLDATRATQPGP